METLTNIYYGAFFCKKYLMSFNCQLFFQKNFTIDASQFPKYIYIEKYSLCKNFGDYRFLLCQIQSFKQTFSLNFIIENMMIYKVKVCFAWCYLNHFLLRIKEICKNSFKITYETKYLRMD